jgi:hypothetical protein
MAHSSNNSSACFAGRAVAAAAKATMGTGRPPNDDGDNDGRREDARSDGETFDRL